MSYREYNPPYAWQNKTWVHLLGAALGILPYLIGFLFPVTDQQVDIKVTSIHILSWSVIVLLILLTLRYLAGERIRNLNLQAGTWWKDMLAGIALAALTTEVLIIFSNPIASLFPGQKEFDLRNLFSEVFKNPWLFALWIGPGLLISSGIGEELARTFVLTRLWKLSSLPAWKWLTIFLYSVLFSLGHIYQGPA